MPSASSDVVVIGGGIGGLSAAAALARDGLEVTLVDAASAPPPDYFGYMLWPPAIRTLSWLGIDAEALAAGCTLRALRWYDGSGVETLSMKPDQLDGGGAFVGVRPSFLHKVLEDLAARCGVTVLRGVADWRLDHQRDAIAVRIQPNAGLQSSETLTGRLVLGCDGSQSRLRARLGLRTLRWRPPRQMILTGVGGAVAVDEAHQVLGVGWSRGCVSLGAGGSWLHAVIREPPMGEPVGALRMGLHAYEWAGEAPHELARVALLRPWSIRVMRWARDRALLLGDAAHAMPPHIGLGGSMTLEDVPVMHETVTEALRRDDLSANALEVFRRRRAARVAYVQRVSELWALISTVTLPGLRQLRDIRLRRIAEQPSAWRDFLETIARGGTPSVRTRILLGLP